MGVTESCAEPNNKHQHRRSVLDLYVANKHDAKQKKYDIKRATVKGVCRQARHSFCLVM